MKSAPIVVLAMALLAGGCEREAPLLLTGSTDFDRIGIPAEASEPVVSLHVREGEAVQAGQLLLVLDASRYEARIRAAEARLQAAQARLAELESGPRRQTIARAAAELESVQAAMVEADLAFERAAELLRRDLTSQAALDQARATRDQRHAAAAASRAMLDELQAGTRPEQIDQAAAEVAAQAADLDELRESRNRLTLKAPRAGRVDALPFEPGDQPAAGATLVSLLVGELPYARIFVPAHIRAGLSEGDRFSVEVLGVERRFAATLRSISREASFTPYYALSGDDASRTVFRAELHFTEPAAADLPAGLPLTATPLVPGAADD